MVKLLTESLTFFKATQTYLSEAFEMEDEYVRERPQAHLHHALLQLFTVGTFPGIVRIELELVREFNSCQKNNVGVNNLYTVWPFCFSHGSPEPYEPLRKTLRVFILTAKGKVRGVSGFLTWTRKKFGLQSNFYLFHTNGHFDETLTYTPW